MKIILFITAVIFTLIAVLFIAICVNRQLNIHGSEEARKETFHSIFVYFNGFPNFVWINLVETDSKR